MRKARCAVLACAAALLVSGMWTSAAEAASRYGPAGLGANIHKRFVINQAIKKSRRGQTVRNRQILWRAAPYNRGRLWRVR